MLKTLVLLECKRILGINVLLHSGGQKTLRRHTAAQLAAYLLVLTVVSVSLAGKTAGLVQLGAGAAAPVILVLAGSALVLLVSLPGMGGSLYAEQGLDLLRAMPVRSEAIALSRLLGRYAEALPMTAMLLPGTILCGLLSGQGLRYYLVMLAGLLFVPLLPLAASALLGGGILWLAARTKHPVGVQTVLQVLLLALVLGGGLLLQPLPDPSLPPEALAEQLAAMLTGRLGYPPANWLGAAAFYGDFGGFAAFLALSLGVFATVAVVLCHSFDRIMASLSARHGGGSCDLQRIGGASPLKALYDRERRRYFASPIYVSNTVIGPILAFAAAAALLFLDLTPAEAILPLPVRTLAPMAWSAICCLLPAASVAVTMEGRQIWQIQTLPVSVRTWLNSKLLWNLTLMAPSYLLSQLAMTAAFRPMLPELLWQLTLPLAMMVFSCVFGLAADLRFHRFDFDREETAVKQSLSALAGGLAGPAVGLLGCGVLLLTGGSALAQGLIVLGLALGTAALHRRNGRIAMEVL